MSKYDNKKFKSLKFGNFGAFFPKKYLLYELQWIIFWLPSDKTKCQNKTIDNMSSKHSFTLEILMI